MKSNADLLGALESLRYKHVRGSRFAGWCGEVEADERAVVLRISVPHQELARLLSGALPGQFWPGAGGVSWRLGRHTTWLVPRELLPQVADARAVVSSLTDEPAPWTVGACVRSLMRWAVPAQGFDARNERLAQAGTWGYHLVLPGEYPHLELADLKACYYELLARAPTPHVSLLPRRLVWHPVPPDAQERWRELLDRVVHHKLVRNALVGACVGSEGGARYYHKGEERLFRGARGPLRALGLLVIRTAMEVCAIQAAEAGAVYANVDCVAAPRPAACPVWDSLGLPWSVKATGPASIQALGAWRIGGKESGHYLPGRRVLATDCASAVPSRLVHRCWL